MRHVYSLSDVSLSTGSIVTIGAFDGVHRGHSFLLNKLVKSARQRDMEPIVITFYPHPDVVLREIALPYYMTLPDEKAALLGDLGVSVVVTHPFDETIRHIRAADFVDQLVKYLKMKSLWVGENFALGYQREGDIPFLRDLGRSHGFAVETVDLMDAGGERVSSSRIRAALSEGDLSEVNRLLGRAYAIGGEVIEGAKRGQLIGIPTANLRVSSEKLLPPNGVYAAWAMVGGRRHSSVVNIGVRPTFDGLNAQVHVESHILEFDGDIYGDTITLEFVNRLRNERKFDGVEQLVAQITRDIAAARTVFASIGASPRT